MYDGNEGNIGDLVKAAGAKVIGTVHKDARFSESSDNGEIPVLKYDDIGSVFEDIVEELVNRSITPP